LEQFAKSLVDRIDCKADIEDRYLEPCRPKDTEAVDPGQSICLGREVVLDLQAHIRGYRMAICDFVFRSEGGQIGNKEQIKEKLDQACFMADVEGLEFLASQGLQWRSKPWQRLMGAIFVKEPGNGVLVSKRIFHIKLLRVGLLLLLVCSIFPSITIKVKAKHLDDAGGQ
jgi:hypothetical protein